MKLKCAKCGKEIKDGSVCISMLNKKDLYLCADCATIEALEMHGDKRAEDTLKEMKNA